MYIETGIWGRNIASERNNSSANNEVCSFFFLSHFFGVKNKEGNNAMRGKQMNKRRKRSYELLARLLLLQFSLLRLILFATVKLI